MPAGRRCRICGVRGLSMGLACNSKGHENRRRNPQAAQDSLTNLTQHSSIWLRITTSPSFLSCQLRGASPKERPGRVAVLCHGGIATGESVPQAFSAVPTHRTGETSEKSTKNTRELQEPLPHPCELLADSEPPGLSHNSQCAVTHLLEHLCLAVPGFGHCQDSRTGHLEDLRPKSGSFQDRTPRHFYRIVTMTPFYRVITAAM